tara:strand:- start:6140 stop:6259 length:120 start_codon:yes stop_codon:yes gene_type:complete
MISSVRNSLKINSSGALEEIMKLIKKASRFSKSGSFSVL